MVTTQFAGIEVFITLPFFPLFVKSQEISGVSSHPSFQKRGGNDSLILLIKDFEIISPLIHSSVVLCIIKADQKHFFKSDISKLPLGNS